MEEKSQDIRTLTYEAEFSRLQGSASWRDNNQIWKKKNIQAVFALVFVFTPSLHLMVWSS